MTMTFSERTAARRGPALLLSMGLLLLAACGGDAPEAAPEEAAPLVLAQTDVVPVARGQISGGVALTGTLEPALVVEVKAQISGTLGTVRVREGDRVGEGAVLATIVAEGIRSQASSSTAAVAAAEAQLALAREGAESAELLYREGAMSRLDYQAAQAQVEAAQAQVAAARSQASGAGEQAARTVLRSPLTGAVSTRTAEVGEAVSPGQTLFTVVNTSALELAAQVGANQAALISVGSPVEFRLDAYPGEVFRGTVARIEPTADPVTRQVGVYLRLPNRGDFVGGLFATGTIVLETLEDALLVPATALREDGAATFVLAVTDGTIQRRNVTVTARDAGRGVAAVTGEIAEGDAVIVAPTTDTAVGARVRIAGEAAVPASDSTAVPVPASE